MILALALLVLPYFVMMPGMGMGIAASRTPFGCGMYLTAWLMQAAA